MQPVLLSTAYFPPIAYFAKIVQSNRIIIEAEENYHKQTYRNRCIILGANGPLNLVLPILHGPEKKQKIRQVIIDYNNNWQQIHSRALESAYRNSPYYDYYIDDINPFFQNQYKSLIEFNTQILKTCCTILKIALPIEFTSVFEKSIPDISDYRYSITPKNEENNSFFKPYRQVFDDKFGFTPNLSILDLVFAVGPESHDIIKGI